jgi:ATP synthase protein I
MSDNDEPSPPTSDPLDDFDRRLRERIEARDARRRGKKSTLGSGLGIAWRLSVEFVVALGVGGALGYGIDKLAGTGPWIMLIGGLFGFAAGVRNAVRAAAELQKLAAEEEQSGDRR